MRELTDFEREQLSDYYQTRQKASAHMQEVIRRDREAELRRSREDAELDALLDDALAAENVARCNWQFAKSRLKQNAYRDQYGWGVEDAAGRPMSIRDAVADLSPSLRARNRVQRDDRARLEALRQELADKKAKLNPRSTSDVERCLKLEREIRTLETKLEN